MEITLEKIITQFIGTFRKDKVCTQGLIGLHKKEEK
jgi:hypothetical protein